MARLPRVVIVDVPHHVTQRGNARQVIFRSDADRLTYLELLRKHCELYRLSLLGYCLMSNHVHLIVIPRTAQSLSDTLKHTQGRVPPIGMPASLPADTCGRDASIPARSTNRISGPRCAMWS